MRSFKKLRSDSYEATLTPQQREQLYAWLLDPGLPQEEVCRRTPPWPSGKRAGRKPSEAALSNIGRRVRLEATLDELEAAAAVRQAAMVKLLQEAAPDGIHEDTVNLIMQLVGQEVIQKTLSRMDPGSRTAAAGLMLKRSDQGLDRAKFLLEVRKYQDALKTLKEKNQGVGNKPRRQGASRPR